MNGDDEPVVVVATIEPASGREAEVEQALREAVRAVHTEPGCQLYALHRALDEPLRFVMVEKWSSGSALAEHGRGPALTELGTRLEGMLNRPLDVVRLSALPEGDEQRGRL